MTFVQGKDYKGFHFAYHNTGVSSIWKCLQKGSQSTSTIQITFHFQLPVTGATFYSETDCTQMIKIDEHVHRPSFVYSISVCALPYFSFMVLWFLSFCKLGSNYNSTCIF